MPTLVDSVNGPARFLDRVEAVAAAAPSGRQPTMLERTAVSGSMPPLHVCDEDETYLVLGGEVTFYVGADTVPASKGDMVVAPRAVPRTFRVESEDARWLVLTRVSSLERYRDFTRAVSTFKAEAWPCDAERYGLEAIARANGIEILGPPGALP